MDLILSLSALGMGFAAAWVLIALLAAAIAGGLVVAVFGSVFFVASRVAARASEAQGPAAAVPGSRGTTDSAATRRP